MKIGVIGLGKLGSCLAAVLAQTYTVIGIDLNEETVNAINTCKSPPHIVEPTLDALLEHSKLIASTDYKRLAGCDMIFVIVPTPSQDDNTFTYEYVDRALGSIYAELMGWPERSTPLPVVIVSTLTPGMGMRCLDRYKREWLNNRAWEIELIYSPTFVALGQVVQDFCNPSAMLIGTGDGFSSFNVDLLVEVFRKAVFIGNPPIHLMDWEEAELAKLFLNVMLSVKSLFANELAALALSLSADATKVLDFVGADKRIGKKMLGAAFPPGGPCLPRDVRCISVLARRFFGRNDLFSTLERISVVQMVEICEDIVCFVNDPVLICGLGYKVGAPAEGEAASISLRAALERAGRVVQLHDFDIQTGDPKQIDSLDESPESIVICTNDRRYMETLTPMKLKDKTVYDVWGVLPPEHAKACKDYQRFGNWRD